MYPPPDLSLYLLNFVLLSLCWGNIYLKEWFYPPPPHSSIKITTQVVEFCAACSVLGKYTLKSDDPPIPHFSIKTTTQVVCSILSCLLWTVEQYLSCALTLDSYTETPPQKFNVNVLHSVLLYLPCARTPGRCRDPGSLCWRWPSLCTGNCRKFSMIRYGSVSLPCTEEEKTMHFNYVHHMS